MRLFLILIFCFARVYIFAQSSSIEYLIPKIESSVFTIFALDENGKTFSQGSGFFIGSNGIGVTNFHVLDGAYNAQIKTKNGEIIPIDYVLDYDKDADLVKFHIKNANRQYKALKIAPAIPKRGSEIISLSSPLGLEQTLSVGIVSAVRSDDKHGEVIQITAPISHGSSGSPLLNTKGEVVGISTFGIEQGQNLNFAVSSGKLNELYKNLKCGVYNIWNNPLETEAVKKASALKKQGDLSSAILILRKEILKNPMNHIALAHLAFCMNENRENGAEYIQRACAIDSLNATYLNILGILETNSSDVTNGNIDNIKTACNAYMKAIEIAPSYEEPYMNLANLLYKSCYHYKLLNNDALQLALKAINSAINLNPSAKIFETSARVKVALKDFGGAILDCDNAIALNSEWSRAYFTKGDIKAFEMSDLHGGLLDIEKALSLVDYNYTNQKELAYNKGDMLGIKAIICWRLTLKEKDASFFIKTRDALTKAYDLTGNKRHLQILDDYYKEIKDIISRKGVFP